MPTSLITGANGFAGSHLAEYLLDRGHRVICLVRKTSDLSNLKGLDVEYRYGEVIDKKSLEDALGGVEYVFHLAGLTKAKTEAEYMRVNAGGTANIAEACLKHASSVKMLVYCSSLAASGPQQGIEAIDEKTPPRPITAYGRSKLAGEEALRKIGGKVRWCIVRPTGIYGPRDKDIFIYFKVINKGYQILLSGAGRKVSMIYAWDFAQFCYRAATRSPHGEVYMASDGGGYTWQEISRKIAAALNKQPIEISIPMWVTTPAAWLMELSGSIQGKAVTLNREKVRELQAPGWVINIEKAQKVLGFEPEYTLLEGVKATAKWYRKNGWLK